MSQEVMPEIANDSTVAQETEVTPESQDGNVENSAQANTVPETVPYNRFSEVNQEKNDLKKMYAELSQNVNQYIQDQNRREDEKKEAAEIPHMETVEDVLDFVKKNVTQEVDKIVKPMKENAEQQNYHNTLNKFFGDNPGAKRDQIDSYFDSLPEYRRNSIAQSIKMGDTSALTEIQALVERQENQAIQQMANTATQQDTNQAFSPSQSRVVRTGEPTLQDKMAKMKETGDTRSVFEELAQRML